MRRRRRRARRARNATIVGPFATRSGSTPASRTARRASPGGRSRPRASASAAADGRCCRRRVPRIGDELVGDPRDAPGGEQRIAVVEHHPRIEDVRRIEQSIRPRSPARRAPRGVNGAGFANRWRSASKRRPSPAVMEEKARAPPRTARRVPRRRHVNQIRGGTNGDARAGHVDRPAAPSSVTAAAAPASSRTASSSVSQPGAVFVRQDAMRECRSRYRRPCRTSSCLRMTASRSSASSS